MRESERPDLRSGAPDLRRGGPDLRRRGLALGAPTLLLSASLAGFAVRADNPRREDGRDEIVTGRAEDPEDWPFDQAGAVAALTGAARAVLAQEMRALALNAPVYVGDLLRTAAESRMTLALGRRTTLRLGAATEIRLERYIVDAGGEIVFADGALLFDREDATPDAPLTVEGAYGLIAVRGTRFFAGPSGAPFAVFAERGTVSVTAGGREVVLSAGQGTEIVAPGAAPSAPILWSAERVAAALALTG
ncbi:MAG: FecR family protein [Pseudomonadota bacterium]